MEHYYSVLASRVRASSVSEEEWKLFVERTRVKYVTQGSHLIEAGEFVNCAFFCAEGLFRLFYTLSDGREYNVGFSLENDFVTSYAAMVKAEPSSFTVTALEDSVVIEVTYDLLQELMDQSHMWERFIRKCVERLYTRKEERERELLYLSAKQRYEAFLLKYPGLEKRIPQYHVASYLGISPVSLSRLLHAVNN